MLITHGLPQLDFIAYDLLLVIDQLDNRYPQA